MHKDHQILRLTATQVTYAEQLFKLFGEVFEEDDLAIADTAWLEKLLVNPAFICFAAMEGHDVIGGITAYELPMYRSASSEMFIYDIAVHAAYQRKGVGRQLISALSEYCRANGIEQLFVDANAEDEHALEFYRATGGTEVQVMQFTYHVKP